MGDVDFYYSALKRAFCLTAAMNFIVCLLYRTAFEKTLQSLLHLAGHK